MFRFKFTRHVIEQARAKGFTPEELHAACYAPSRTSDVRAHPGSAPIHRGPCGGRR